MHVVKSKKFKRCKDGTVINELQLDEKITAVFIEYLRKFGDVRVLADLDPPFYSCTLEGYLTLKGMLDDDCIHIRASSVSSSAAIDLFRSLLADYPEWISGNLQGN